jgi:molybdopterin-guanine dinucleotide biosynthesis protein A
MGENKALLTLGGEPLVKRGLRKLKELCSEVAIAGGDDELMAFGRVVRDRRAGCGPLGGIVAALEVSSFAWNLFLAVDVPFVPVSMLATLLRMAAGFDGVCVMPRVQDRPEPLCALYSKRALPVLRQELEAGRWKVTTAIQAAGSMRFLDLDDGTMFTNLNTPEEFAVAERRVDLLDS